MVNQQRGHQKGPAPQTGCANYTTMEEIPTGEEVLAGTFFLNEHPVIILFDSLAGTFFLNEHPVIILFDSRVSHDFTSSTCAKKAGLSMVATEAPYVISTPGGQVDVDQIVHKAPLELAERLLSINLIRLKGQGLDVILGMSWMKVHRAVLDIAGQLVHLDTPIYGKVILHLPTILCIKASLHHVLELKLEDSHVIQEFLDVFHDDLPEMPPERAIEFKIELQPGTAPIAKAPYKMSPIEMKELKIQLQDLIDKRLYPPKYIALGLFSLVYRKEGQRATSMCGLLTTHVTPAFYNNKIMSN
jgi:hypothetical protein